MLKKNGLIVLALGALGFLISGTSANVDTPSYKDENKVFLLACDNSVVGNEEKVLENQDFVLNNLRAKIGYKFTYLGNYTKASNMIKIRANSDLEEEISNVNGVRKVYIDQMYRFSEVGQSQKTDLEEGYIANSIPSEIDADEEEDFVLKDEQLTNYSALAMDAPVDSSESNLGAGTLVAILDASFMIEHTWFQDLDGVNLKYTKEEMKNLVDSSSLVGAPKKGVEQGKLGSTYYNNKIPYYYDYGGDSDHSNRNDYDVLSRWDDHGTHVAGIVGANGVYKGIAPNAQLALMKVFRESITKSNDLITASVGAYDSDILEALEDCAVLKPDVLNMSLGSDLDDFSSKSGSLEALENLRNQGCLVNISAGNDGKENYSTMGPYMNWTTGTVETGILGSYANDDSSMIVAATTLEKNYYEDALIVKYDENGQTITQPTSYKDQAKTAESPNEVPDELKFSTLESLADADGQIEYAFISNYTGSTDDDKFGSSTAHNDFKKNYKSKTGEDFDATGKIAVVDRGDISFSKKATAAYEAGYAGLVVINNDPTATEFNFSMAWGDSTGYEYPKIPVVFVLYRDRKYFSKTDNLGLGSLSIAKKTIADNPDQNKIANYSSDGSTYDLRMNPDISAPGSNVLSCIPGITKNDDEYTGRYAYYDKAWAYLDGTSMAAPNLCGANALMISDLTEGMSEEDRLEVIKTIQMREMSTANQYTVDNLDPQSGDVTEESVDFSPRRQGAGVVDVRKTIKSSVYLEGKEVNSDGSFADGIGKAKIELKNNDLIKDGTIKLEFIAHNNSDTSKTYKAKFNVLCPHVEEYYDYENHKEEGVTGKDYKFENGTKFQTIKDHCLHTKDLGNVTVKANGDTVLSFSDELSDSEKSYLKETFENGTYLEGYVTLEAINNNDVDLSIPYMGFFGSYADAPAIEDFDIEKETVDENGKEIFYPSDLVNYIGYGTTLGLTKMNVSSSICSMNYDTYYKLKSSSDILYNKGSVKNASRVATYNKETNTIYAGGSDSDVLYLQAFVLRSIESNSITIKDETGKVVETVGDSGFSDSIIDSNYLYKSHVSSSYINSGIICHKAQAYIPLYQKNSPNNKLPDGNYTIEMEFKVLGSQTTQSKKFNLVIDSLTPSIQSKDIVTKDNEKYIRIKYQETYLQRTNANGNVIIAVNGGSDFDLTKYSEGYYIDYKLDTALANDEDGKVSVSIIDGAGNQIFDMFYLNNENNGNILVESNNLVPGSSFEVSENEIEVDQAYDFVKSYHIVAYDYNSKIISEANFGSYRISITFDEVIDASSVVVLDNSEQNIAYEISDNRTLTFKTSTRNNTIKLNFVKSEKIEEKSTISPVIWIVGGSVLAVVIFLAIFFILKFKVFKAK